MQDFFTVFFTLFTVFITYFLAIFDTTSALVKSVDNNITVTVFTLSVTVMLLLTDLTSAPNEKSIGIEYCQKISENVSPILLVAMPILQY